MALKLPKEKLLKKSNFSRVNENDELAFKVKPIPQSIM